MDSGRVRGGGRRLWHIDRLPSGRDVSGLAGSFPYTMISSGSDFRYIWWLMLATLIGIALFLFGPSPAQERAGGR